MEQLKESFGRHGLTYNLIKRNDKLCIYGVSGTYTNKILHYEVMLIRINKARTTWGKDFPESESIPSDEQFGKSKPDRHYQTTDKAESYFNAWNDCLVEGLSSKQTNEILSSFDNLPA
jgi:hypothetical protein